MIRKPKSFSKFCRSTLSISSNLSPLLRPIRSMRWSNMYTFRYLTQFFAAMSVFGGALASPTNPMSDIQGNEANATQDTSAPTLDFRHPTEYSTNLSVPALPQPAGLGVRRTLQVFSYYTLKEVQDKRGFLQFFLAPSKEVVDACSATPIHFPYKFSSLTTLQEGQEWWMIKGDWNLKVDGHRCVFQGLGFVGPSNDVAYLHCPHRKAIMCVEGGWHANHRLIRQYCSKDYLSSNYKDGIVSCEL